MILQCAVILAFLTIGELIVWLTGVKIPSSIIGMILLALALHFKIVKLRYVEKVADFLVKNLGFFFIPAGVALVLYFDVLKAQWIPIVGASVVSTIIVLLVTGVVYQLMRKIISHHGGVSRK